MRKSAEINVQNYFFIIHLTFNQAKEYTF